MSVSPASTLTIPRVRTRFWNSFPILINEIEAGFEQHGDFIELTGLPYRVFCLRDPEQIEVVMKHPIVGSAKCPSVFARLRALMPKSAVVQPGGTMWTDKRQKIQNILTNEAVSRYARVTIDATTQLLDERWDRHADSGTAFNIYEELQLLLTRIGLRIFFSKSISDVELQQLHAKFTTVESEFVRRLPPILPTRQDATVRRFSRDIRQFMAELIDERAASHERPGDLISLLLEDNDPGDLQQCNAMIDQMIELFTSVRLCAPPLGLGLRMLVDNPEVQSRLSSEVNALIGGRELEYGDLTALKYHQMVVSEIFRLYPSAAALPRWCKDGMSIGDYSIPPRSIVVPMIYHTHRNAKVYPNPKQFLPDRWHPDAPPIHSYARLGFGHGKRTCPGMPLALMIIRTIIASIAQRYRLQFADDQWQQGEIELQIHPSRPIRVRLSGRTDEALKCDANCERIASSTSG